MTTVVLVSESPRVSFEQAQEIARAIDYQMFHDVAPAWQREPWRVSAVATRAEAPPGALVLSLLEGDPYAGIALGLHSETSAGIVYGEILVAPILDEGGDVLTGPGSVASVVSHEVLETFLDASVSTWDQGPDGRLYAHEACDAVESDVYETYGVSVSNFVLPAFFDPNASSGPFDFLGKLTKPFETGEGGYQTVLAADATGALVVSQEYGAAARLDKARKRAAKRSSAFRLATAAPPPAPAPVAAAGDWFQIRNGGGPMPA